MAKPKEPSTVRLWLASIARHETDALRVKVFVQSTLPRTEPLVLAINEKTTGRRREFPVLARSQNTEEPTRNDSELLFRLKPEPIGELWRWTCEVAFPFAIRHFISVQVRTEKGENVTKVSGKAPWLSVVEAYVAQSKVEDELRKKLGTEAFKIELKRKKEFPRLASVFTTAHPMALTDDAREEADAPEAQLVKKVAAELKARLDAGLASLWTQWEAGEEKFDANGERIDGARPDIALDELEALAFGNGTFPAAGFRTQEEAQIYVANELWARQITEMLSLTSYGGPGGAYLGWSAPKQRLENNESVEDIVSEDLKGNLAHDLGGFFNHDADYLMMQGISADPDRADAFYPLMAACQHLASLGVFSRGTWMRPIQGATKKNKDGTVSQLHLARAAIAAGSISASLFTQRLDPPGAWMKKLDGSKAEPIGDVPSLREQVLDEFQKAGKDLNDDAVKFEVEKEVQKRAPKDGFAESLGDGVPTQSSGFTTPPMANCFKAAGKNSKGEECELGPGSIAVFANYPTAQIKTDPEVTIDGVKQPLRGNYPQPIIDAYKARIAAYETLKKSKPDAQPPDPPAAGFPVDRSRKLETDNKFGAHAGFVLRVHPETKRIQTFDTGGFGGGGAEPVLLIQNDGDSASNAGLSHKGNLDYAGTDTLRGSAPFRGMGFLPKLDSVGAKKLRDHVRQVLEKARPLGFGRLLFIRGGKLSSLTSSGAEQFNLSNVLVAASPLFRMHDKKNTFSLSRFAWALKELPWADQLAVVLCVHMPHGELAQACIEAAGRDASLTALVDRALKFTKEGNPDLGLKGHPSDAKKWETGPESSLKQEKWGAALGRFERETFLKNASPATYLRRRLLYSRTRPLLEVVAEPGGPPKLLYRYKFRNPVGTLPWYHFMERDQMPFDRAVRPLAAGENGWWTPATHAAWEGDCKSLVQDFAPLHDLFFPESLSGT
jgi:hypothetical protein